MTLKLAQFLKLGGGFVLVIVAVLVLKNNIPNEIEWTSFNNQLIKKQHDEEMAILKSKLTGIQETR